MNLCTVIQTRKLASSNETLWNCKGLFPPVLDARVFGSGPTTNVVVVANSTLPSTFENIWKNSIFRVCADGGANRLYDAIPEPTKKTLIPNIIKGDFDSIRPDVLAYYERAGSQIIHDFNQDTTDLQKALSAVNVSIHRDDRLKYSNIVILGGLGGNISQELSNFNCMFSMPDRKICFVGDTNVVFLMHPGHHTIMCPPGIKCGLIPLGDHVHSVTSRGLKWNLKSTELKFGGLVSSSNEALEPIVNIHTSGPLLWTFDFNEYRVKGHNQPR